MEGSVLMVYVPDLLLMVLNELWKAHFKTIMSWAIAVDGGVSVSLGLKGLNAEGLGGGWTWFGLEGWYKLFAAGMRGIFWCCIVDVVADGIPEPDCLSSFPQAAKQDGATGKGCALWQGN